MSDAARLARAYPGTEFAWAIDAPVSEIEWIDAKPDTDANIQIAIDAEPTQDQLDAAVAARTSITDEVADILEDVLGLLALLPGAGDAVQAKIDALKNRDDYATLKAEALLL